jgi:peptidyl-prolyl cis-trans isomerase B (cyclophilin B)
MHRARSYRTMWPAVLLSVAAAFSLTSCRPEPPPPTPPPPTAGEAATGEGDETADPRNAVVALETERGRILIEVFQHEAPITSQNFLDLVERGFYRDMVFHRVEPGFVVQTGDPTATGTGGFQDPDTGRERTIPLEVTENLSHNEAGVVGMARSMDPDSASSQFYITLDATPGLDQGYAVFGRVLEGMDAVRSIQRGDRFDSAEIVSRGEPPAGQPT